MHLSLAQSHKLMHQTSPSSSIESPRADHWNHANAPQLTSWTSEEHILRSSVGFDANSSRLRASSIVTNPYDEIVSDGFSFHGNKSRYKLGKYSKYSPTPSIKRGKAEKLLKEHGSPPGVRVTAGGRIVADGLSSITSPLLDAQGFFQSDHNNPVNLRFGYNPASTSMPKHINGYVVEIGNGTLCQFVDGELRSLESRNGVLQLHLPAPNLSVHPSMMQIGPFGGAPQAFVPFVPQPVAEVGLGADMSPFAARYGAAANHLPTEREIRVMEQVHSKLEQDLKDLDRHEVLQRALLDQEKRTEIVRARVALINRIDASRRAVENAKKMLQDEPKIAGHSTGLSQSVKRYSVNTQSQRATGKNDLHLACDNLFAKSNLYDLNLRFGHQPRFLGNRFQPNVPNFVPNHQYDFHNQGEPRISPVLQERSMNIGLGVRIDVEGSCDSAQTVKALNVKNLSGSMNLDGSTHQHRRSHAIEIKKPGDEPAGGKSYLNPTSPSYRPSNDISTDSQDVDGPGEILNFVPSPSLVAQMDNLVQSPGQQDRMLDDSAMETHQSSDSSATTADFFPQEAYQYSSRKLRPDNRDIQVNLPAWMPKDGENSAVESVMTPSRPPTKFVFNDESPSDFYSADLPASEECHSGSSTRKKRLESASCGGADDDDQRVCNGPDTASVSNTVPSVHERSFPDAIPGPRLSRQAYELTPPHPNSSISSTHAYFQGFWTGIRQDILGANENEEYRMGYRDGLIQSSFGPSSAPILGFHVRGEQGNRTTGSNLQLDSRGGDQLPSITKAISFPSFGFHPASVPAVPMPPANSLATTPTKHWLGKQERSPLSEVPLDSPTARAEFMSQPNVNINLMRNYSIVGNSSRSMSTDPDRTSPLANRCPGSMLGDMGTLKNPSFAARMKNRKEGYDQQRYQKSATSVAQTNDYARAHFPSQHDGSADDEYGLDNSTIAAQSEDMKDAKKKVKSSKPGSPVKFRASAAVATMRQAAGLGSKKENEPKRGDFPTFVKGSKKPKETDPTLMSSPEKRKWRDTWAKNFRQLKKEEQEEIEKYKQEQPIR